MKKLLNLIAIAAFAIPCFADGLGEGKTALEFNDYVKAAEAFERSCTGGNAQGCLELGALYEQGVGVAQNPYKASSLYAQACREGEAKGCSRMGLTVTP